VCFSYSPTHPATRAHTAVNVPGVTSRYHGTLREISKVTRNKRRLRHIHVNIIYNYLPFYIHATFPASLIFLEFIGLKASGGLPVVTSRHVVFSNTLLLASYCPQIFSSVRFSEESYVPSFRKYATLNFLWKSWHKISQKTLKLTSAGNFIFSLRLLFLRICNLHSFRPRCREMNLFKIVHEYILTTNKE
jgi:hypothetical protein